MHISIKNTQINNRINNINHIIALNIKTIRKTKRLTLMEVGKIIGVTAQQMQRYEMGKSSIKFSILFILSNEFNVDLQYFLESHDA